MKILIPVIVGGIIGYITNWIAIKMLFRPHYERRLFGFKLPFTPGLIPKEKERIAESIGDAVAQHLLTPDAILEHLNKDRIKEAIKSYSIKKWSGIEADDKCIKDALGGYLGEEYNNLRLSLMDISKNTFISMLNNKEVIELLKSKIDVDSILTKDDYLNVSTNISREIAMNIDFESLSMDVEEKIESIINLKIKDLRLDGKKLEDVVPSSTRDYLKDLVEKNKDNISNEILRILDDRSVNFELKRAIGQMIEENFGKLVTMFISTDSIGDKVIISIKEYIMKENNKARLVEFINSYIDKMLQWEMNYIMDIIPDELIDLGINELKKNINKLITDEENKEYLKSFVLNKLLSSEDKVRSEINLIINDGIDRFINSPDLESKVNNIVLNLFDYIEGMRLSSVPKLSDSDKAIGLLGNILTIILRKEVTNILTLIDIKGIVESNIKSFDIEYSEKLILDIASKELRAITYLGGLLGAIMGLITPVLQLLYK